MGKDELGDRIKSLEQIEAGRKFIPLLPICVRLDGRSFSRFTKKLDRPYDKRFSQAMQNTTAKLVEETNAKIGYTQSDEISLILYSDSYDSQVYFNGKIQKIISCLASFTSVTLYKELNTIFKDEYQEKFGNKLPTFDCRAFNAPNIAEAVNCIVWRELDAFKNSVSMATRCYYSHKEMHNQGRADQMDMLMAKGVNWNDYPSFFKRGSYFQRKKIIKRFTTEEIKSLPEKHPAKNSKDFVVERSGVVRLDLPPIAKIINKIEVIIYGAEPEMSVKDQ